MGRIFRLALVILVFAAPAARAEMPPLAWPPGTVSGPLPGASVKPIVIPGIGTPGIGTPSVGPLIAPLLSPALGLLCRQAVAAAEQSYALPAHLLSAIALVESGRKDPQSGSFNPWPWTVDAEGQGHFYPTKAAAVAAVRDLLAQGVASIDVGCMQINIMHHPHAFASLEEAFDPFVNARYAAQFLTELHAQSGNWALAAAHYHSMTPELALTYQQKVMAAWSAEQHGLPVEPASLAMAAGMAPALRPTAGLHGGGATTIFNRQPPPHIIPLTAPPGMAIPPGRGLASYRARPVAYAASPLGSGHGQ